LAAQQSSCPKADAGTVSRRPQIDCIQGPMTAATRILEHEGGVCRDRHQRIDTRRTPCGFYQSRTREGRGRQFQRWRRVESGVIGQTAVRMTAAG
jgi:hypothetical protein